ncbi:hypothetical protein GMORB2_0578 [Geosmithia morbida]|uniref:Uncharacterized protein n=1 Tax=Geosmithia morbida TaxID=1094350 RepID=A0A9P5D7P6_9HYPO|nr:uncharacterized protein GMORB2_0578 [Geosmithia morbida]KAF4126841.1 hypothetical protein GMORB2_0578 [Geosmithia morbida]
MYCSWTRMQSTWAKLNLVTSQAVPQHTRIKTCLLITHDKIIHFPLAVLPYVKGQEDAAP